MSFFDDASLAFLPSGGAGKDTKAYSIKPTDGSGDFTFSRGSNLAATRVGPTGLIEKGRENLLTYSNQFDTTWIKSSPVLTLTDNQSGYDGLSNAWKLESTSSISSLSLSQTLASSGVQVFSVYAKAGSVDWVRINLSGVGNRFFNISNGTIGSAGSLEGTITSAGNGWYRISILGNGSSSAPLIFPSSNDDDTTLSNGDNIYIQDAQLEIGLAATDYIESGATTGKAGLLEDEPRFDYSGGATCPSLLLEPSRINLVPQSEYLSGLSLGNSPTITQNYAVSPEGVQNAVRIQDTDATNFKTIQTQFSISAGSTYTISIYVKKATSPITTYGGFYFDFDGGTRKISNLIFDEYNGTLVNASSNAITSVIHPVIDEGDYWRFSATATDTGSNTLLRATLRAGASTDGTSLTPVIKDYTAYGLQCEQGSYPTSYIPNHSGGTITRGADDCSVTGVSSLIGQTEGVMFMEYDITNLESGYDWFGFNDGATTNRLILGVSDSSTQGYRLFVVSGGTTSIDTRFGNTTAGGVVKVAVKYDNGSYKVFVNGTEELSTTGVSSFAASLTDVDFNDGSSLRITEPVKQFLVFTTALSDADCITLTT